jgi:hypothetical protein
MYDGWAVLARSLRAIRRHPVLIVPLLAIWVSYAATILYFAHLFPWDEMSLWSDLYALFGAIMFLSFTLLASCTLVLEMIRQLESGDAPDLLKASGRLVGADMLHILPLALCWAALWFVLTVANTFGGKDQYADDAFDVADAAETLAGFDRASVWSLSVEAIEKGARMIVFLILPAIVWDGLPFVPAVKKGLGVLRARLSTFMTGYALTYAAWMLVFLPATVMGVLYGKFAAPVSSSAWLGMLIYTGLAWSLVMYLEQMFMAGLYFWQMNWEKAAKAARDAGEEVPRLKDIPLPELLEIRRET